MRFSILGSGSSGNCTLVQTDQTRVLVDAGFSARKLSQLLAASGHSFDQIDAIFLTHEHSDHSAGLTGLAKHPHIKVYANRATARSVEAGLKHKPSWQIFETGSKFIHRDLEIRSFAVPHDAHDPVGFVLSHGDDDLLSARRHLAFLTDLGHAPQNVREQIRDAHVLVVEANHCPTMLQNDTKRPWSLKQRISGRHGHLSNENVRELLESLPTRSLQHVFFTHLSSECNCPAAVETAVGQLLRSRNCGFSIVEPGMTTPFFELR